MPNVTRHTRPGHRTQDERSRETKSKLLDATIDCLMERGYTATTTQEVVRRAGLSRGALAHHFSSKAELVAEATAYMIARRLKTTERMLAQLPESAEGLEPRVRLLWKNYERWFGANIEYMVASRTDAALKAAFDTHINAYIPPQSPAYNGSLLWPALVGDSSPRLTHYVIGCFIRGLCLEGIVNDDKLVEEIFRKFVAILQAALRHGIDEGDAGIRPADGDS